MLFRVLRSAAPQTIDDLSSIDVRISDIAITGKTRNVERLKDCRKLQRVWLQKVNQREFDTIAGNIDPKTLMVYEMRVEDLAALESMQQIEELVLEWNTKATDIGILPKLKTLRALGLIDFPKLSRLDPLSRCDRLETLELSGGMWKPLRLKTLEPLRSLACLKSLSITSVRVEDNSLEPLTALTNLQDLNLSNQFPTEEYARLSVYLEHLTCDDLQPYVSLEGKVIGGKKVMITGKGKPFLDPKEDKERIRKYEQRFKEYQARFKAEKQAAQS